LLIVEAPVDSNPNTPVDNEHHDEFFGHGEGENGSPVDVEKEKPKLPPRTESGNLSA
jgi:hypothetical protein